MISPYESSNKIGHHTNYAIHHNDDIVLIPIDDNCNQSINGPTIQIYILNRFGVNSMIRLLTHWILISHT